MHVVFFIFFSLTDFLFCLFWVMNIGLLKTQIIWFLFRSGFLETNNFSHGSDSVEIENSPPECVIAFFMSHGNEDFLFCRDGHLPYLTLFSAFNEETCPSLKGRPKVFFVQVSSIITVNAEIHVFIHMRYLIIFYKYRMPIYFLRIDKMICI